MTDDPQVTVADLHQTNLQIQAMTTAVSSCVKAIEEQGSVMKQMVENLSQPRSVGITLQHVLAMLAMMAAVGAILYQTSESRTETGFSAIEEDEQQDRIAMLERVRVNTQSIADLRESTESHYNSSIKTNSQHSSGVRANRDSICDVLHKVDPGAPCRDAVEQSYLP